MRARSVSDKYQPPSRYKISGPLLNAVHFTYQVKGAEALMKDGKYTGCTISGDGATIDKTSLINNIASSPGNPSLVLDMVDCTSHMQRGGKKDAPYICEKMLPCLNVIDPNRDFVDLVTFDGASNVQKAARLIRVHYPMITVSPAIIEHTVSLIFARVMKLRPINELCSLGRKV